jgi:putative dimethyl sulfoxide reductase chaperone
MSTDMHLTLSGLRARRASYDLLARLYLDEPDAGLVAYLRGLPPFAEHLLSDAEAEAWLAEGAVEYQRLFGMNVYPYESIFIDRELMLNTAATDHIALLYRICGFDSPGVRVGAPDHLGLELRLMRDLIAAELHAHGRGDADGMHWARTQQARCLHEHLVRWAPICAQAVMRVATQPLYAILASLTTELVLSDLEHVPSTGVPPPITLEPYSTHQEPPPSSDDSDLDPESPAPLRPYSGSAYEDAHGINAIVRHLLTPAEVGVLLTRADISGLGRALQLPVAIGERFQMLRSLFDVAGQFEQLDTLLDVLDQLFAQADEHVAALIEEYPAWGEYGVSWWRRIARGRALLSELRAHMEQYNSASSSSI